MRRVEAHAKINLALVVGPLREDGKHEVVTVLQRVALADVVELSAGDRLSVTGFERDTIVAEALTALAAEARVEPRWNVRITKNIPVAAGLGGGSSDAAAALRLANGELERPLDETRLSRLAASIGADVPFFLRRGAQIGRGDGSQLDPVHLPGPLTVVLVLPHGFPKASTGAVYAAFDERGGAGGFERRRAALESAIAACTRADDLAALPGNDLVRSPHADRLREAGAIRADVSGAGPCVYGLFADSAAAHAAAVELQATGRTWVTDLL